MLKGRWPSRGLLRDYEPLCLLSCCVRRLRRCWRWWTGTGTASSASPSSGAWWAPTPSCSDVCTSSCSVQTFLNYLSTSNLINIHNSVTKFNGCSCIEATWLCCFNEPITLNALLPSSNNDNKYVQQGRYKWILTDFPNILTTFWPLLKGISPFFLTSLEGNSYHESQITASSS